MRWFTIKHITIAVSKTQSIQKIRAKYKEGYRHFGENYLLEALNKQQELTDLDITWHFIGPIQSNKTKDIAKHFHWIHSVDRLKIAHRLSEQATHPLNILIQVNPQKEDTKAGVLVADVPELVESVLTLKNLHLKGFMCIPSKDHPEEAFKIMNSLKQHYQLSELSMGMSADYELALRYGATMIRLGTHIFGSRA